VEQHEGFDLAISVEERQIKRVEEWVSKSEFRILLRWLLKNRNELKPEVIRTSLKHLAYNRKGHPRQALDLLRFFHRKFLVRSEDILVSVLIFLEHGELEEAVEFLYSQVGSISDLKVIPETEMELEEDAAVSSTIDAAKSVNQAVEKILELNAAHISTLSELENKHQLYLDEVEVDDDLREMSKEFRQRRRGMLDGGKRIEFDAKFLQDFTNQVVEHLSKNRQRKKETNLVTQMPTGPAEVAKALLTQDPDHHSTATKNFMLAAAQCMEELKWRSYKERTGSRKDGRICEEILQRIRSIGGKPTADHYAPTLRCYTWNNRTQDSERIAEKILAECPHRAPMVVNAMLYMYANIGNCSLVEEWLAKRDQLEITKPLPNGLPIDAFRYTAQMQASNLIKDGFAAIETYRSIPKHQRDGNLGMKTLFAVGRSLADSSEVDKKKLKKMVAYCNEIFTNVVKGGLDPQYKGYSTILTINSFVGNVAEVDRYYTQMESIFGGDIKDDIYNNIAGMHMLTVGNPHAAEVWMNYSKQAGKIIERKWYLCLMSTYASMKMDKCAQIVQMMMENGHKPDLEVYRTCIYLACGLRDIVAAEKWANRLTSSGEQLPLSSFNSIIRLCAKLDQPSAQRARMWFEYMLSSGLKPSNRTINNLFLAESKENLKKAIVDAMRRLGKFGLDGDPFFFHQAAKKLAEFSSVAEAIALKDELVARSSPEYWKEEQTELIFHEILKGLNIRLDKLCIREENVEVKADDKNEVIDQIKSTVEEMKQLGVRRTHSICAEAISRIGSLGYLPECLHIYNLCFEGRRLSNEMGIVNRMLKAHLRSGDVQSQRKWLRRMIKDELLTASSMSLLLEHAETSQGCSLLPALRKSDLNQKEKLKQAFLLFAGEEKLDSTWIIQKIEEQNIPDIKKNPRIAKAQKRSKKSSVSKPSKNRDKRAPASWPGNYSSSSSPEPESWSSRLVKSRVGDS